MKQYIKIYNHENPVIDFQYRRVHNGKEFLTYKGAVVETVLKLLGNELTIPELKKGVKVEYNAEKAKQTYLVMLTLIGVYAKEI